MSTERIVVDRRVADDFVSMFAKKARSLPLGDPRKPEPCVLGSVIGMGTVEHCNVLIDDALAKGAKLVCGGKADSTLMPATLLDHVTPDMPVVKYETFGPVSPVIRFTDIDEAITMVNSTDYGLSSAVCTNRLDYITRLVSELNVGTVNVREVPGYRLESTPFGGIKDSGLGYKEGVQEAMKSFTNTKTYSLPW
jgi:acyl-CoA reductase-like NAD-dependent aldehyde dehydrogenase